MVRAERIGLIIGPDADRSPILVSSPTLQLRDPAVFVDDDARVYLFYSVVAECGIAVAQIFPS